MRTVWLWPDDEEIEEGQELLIEVKLKVIHHAATAPFPGFTECQLLDARR
jgi:hypothetical protein